MYNLLGVADNRIYNSGFNEVDSNSQPLEWLGSAPAGSTNLSEEDPTAPYGGSRVLKLNSGTNHNTYQWTDNIQFEQSPQIRGYNLHSRELLTRFDTNSL